MNNQPYHDIYKKLLPMVDVYQVNHYNSDRSSNLLFIKVVSPTVRTAGNGSQTGIRIKPNKDKLNAELLSQYFSTEQYWRWIAFTYMRSGQPEVNGNEYASMLISLPKSLEEQQKIADCLSSLDELIAAQAGKIEALKLHKKRLMQGLFPSLEEA